MKLYKYIGGKVENEIKIRICLLKNKFNELMKKKNMWDYDVIQMNKNLDDLLIHYMKSNIKIQ